MARKSTELLILHCSATPPTMDIGVKEIDRWHRARGFFKIGYHFVIRRNGVVEKGRAIEEPGAHAKGYNHKSIGICLVGGDEDMTTNDYTDAQWAALKALLDELHGSYPEAKIIGHNEVNPHKACPSFDVQEWLASLD